MTKTNTLRSAILIALAAVGTAAYAAGPAASGAAEVGIDTGANARLSAPAQINKPIGAPNTLNPATPAMPSIAPGAPAIPAIPGNPSAAEKVLDQRPDRQDTTTRAPIDSQTNTGVGGTMTSPAAPAAASSMGAGGSIGTNADADATGSNINITGPGGSAAAAMDSPRASGSADTSTSANSDRSADSLVIREELDAKGGLDAAALPDGETKAQVKAQAKTLAKKSNRNKVTTQREAKSAVETN